MKKMRTKAKQYHMPGYFTIEKLGYGFLLRDAKSDRRHDELRWYYNDLYQIFLYTLATINHETASPTDTEAQRLKNMLAEIISVKTMLETPER